MPHAALKTVMFSQRQTVLRKQEEGLYSTHIPIYRNIYLEWNIIIQDVPKDMILQAHTQKTQHGQDCTLYPSLCSRAVHCGPWWLTVALGQLENLSCFTEIICWAPWIIFSHVEALASLQFFSTALVT